MNRKSGSPRHAWLLKLLSGTGSNLKELVQLRDKLVQEISEDISEMNVSHGLLEEACSQSYVDVCTLIADSPALKPGADFAAPESINFATDVYDAITRYSNVRGRIDATIRVLLDEQRWAMLQGVVSAHISADQWLEAACAVTSAEDDLSVLERYVNRKEFEIRESALSSLRSKFLKSAEEALGPPEPLPTPNAHTSARESQNANKSLVLALLEMGEPGIYAHWAVASTRFIGANDLAQLGDYIEAKSSTLPQECAQLLLGAILEEKFETMPPDEPRGVCEFLRRAERLVFPNGLWMLHLAEAIAKHPPLNLQKNMDMLNDELDKVVHAPESEVSSRYLGMCEIPVNFWDTHESVFGCLNHRALRTGISALLSALLINGSSRILSEFASRYSDDSFHAVEICAALFTDFCEHVSKLMRDMQSRWLALRSRIATEPPLVHSFGSLVIHLTENQRESVEELGNSYTYPNYFAFEESEFTKEAPNSQWEATHDAFFQQMAEKIFHLSVRPFEKMLDKMFETKKGSESASNLEKLLSSQKSKKSSTEALDRDSNSAGIAKNRLLGSSEISLPQFSASTSESALQLGESLLQLPYYLDNEVLENLVQPIINAIQCEILRRMLCCKNFSDQNFRRQLCHNLQYVTNLIRSIDFVVSPQLEWLVKILPFDTENGEKFCADDVGIKSADGEDPLLSSTRACGLKESNKYWNSLLKEIKQDGITQDNWNEEYRQCIKLKFERGD